MPYLRIDDEGGWADDDSDLSPAVTPGPSGTFEYEPATAHFAPAKLVGPAATVCSMLIDRGATRFRGTYDGGHDEGFAHAETVWFGADPKPVEVVADTLGTKEFHTRLADAAADPKASHWHNAAKMYREDSAAAAVARALDELAHEIAAALLGGGFGTGEYSLYGAFEVDFSSGQITDDPAAGKPLNLD
jgi:hypothetical protein